MFRWNRSVLASLNHQLSCEANFVSRVYASDDQVKMVVRGVSCLLSIVASEHHLILLDITFLGHFVLRIRAIFTDPYDGFPVLCGLSQKRHWVGYNDDTKYCDAIAEQVRVSDKFKLEVGRDRRGRTFNMFEYLQLCF